MSSQRQVQSLDNISYINMSNVTQYEAEIDLLHNLLKSIDIFKRSVYELDTSILIILSVGFFISLIPSLVQTRIGQKNYLRIKRIAKNENLFSQEPPTDITIT